MLQDIANRPTRRDIANLASNDPILQTYRSAITKMQALPMSDGTRNWTNQASIHNNSCARTARGSCCRGIAPTSCISSRSAKS